VRQLIFTGEHHVQIDEGSQLTLPAEISTAAGSEAQWFVRVGLNETLWLYAIEPGDDSTPLERAAAVRMAVDEAGRLLLPRAMLEPKKLQGHAMLIGARDHLELWNDAAWTTNRDRLTEKFRNRR
jgi:DNA-binding transcriptional regulator/RsmH inhibitor MraZ